MALTKKGIRIWALLHFAFTVLGLLIYPVWGFYTGSLSSWMAFGYLAYGANESLGIVCGLYLFASLAFSISAYVMTFWKGKRLWFFAMCCMDVIFTAFFFAYIADGGVSGLFWFSLAVQAFHAAAFFLLTGNRQVKTKAAVPDEKTTVVLQVGN